MVLPWPIAWIAFIFGMILFFVADKKLGEFGRLLMFAGALAILLHH